MQLTSGGGSYRSKNLESTPIKNGKGACKTSTKPEQVGKILNKVASFAQKTHPKDTRECKGTAT